MELIGAANHAWEVVKSSRGATGLSPERVTPGVWEWVASSLGRVPADKVHILQQGQALRNTGPT